MSIRPSSHSSIHIGISGWRYAPWRGVFYPDKLPQRSELEFASRALSSIEINGTFYGTQKPASFARWYADTPDDFLFSVKAPRHITHILRLKEIQQPLADFFASGLLELRQKLGPVLWQFPPSFRFDARLMDDFMEGLPRDTEAALELARQHSGYKASQAWFDVNEPRELRHAIEIRNKSFAHPEFINMLRHHGVALVVADTAGKWPYLEDVTADFMYLRLHGDTELYASGYTDRALDRWAERIALWSKGLQPDDAHLVANDAPDLLAQRDIHCYFDNDIKVHAPFDAIALNRKLGRSNGIDERHGEQLELVLD